MSESVSNFESVLTLIFNGTIAISAIVAVISFIVSICRRRADLNVASDIKICEQATRSLKRAYKSLELSDNGFPKPERLNWLTAARHIIKYRDLKEKINTDTYRTILEDEEEHWRHQFYLILDHERLGQSTYYTKGRPESDAENIEPTSAKVVVAFSNWPEGKNDPIDSVDKEDPIISGCFQGRAGLGLRSYIQG